MGFFQGSIDNQVDKKGRVSVPAAFRKLIQERSGKDEINVRPSRPGRLPHIEALDDAALAPLFDRLNELDPNSDEHFEETQLLFGQNQLLKFDQPGRIILPRGLLDHAGIGTTVRFVGQGNMFSIWDPATHDRQLDIARRKREQKAAQAASGGT